MPTTAECGTCELPIVLHTPHIHCRHCNVVVHVFCLLPCNTGYKVVTVKAIVLRSEGGHP